MFLLYDTEGANMFLCNHVLNCVMSYVFKERFGGEILSFWLDLTFKKSLLIFPFHVFEKRTFVLKKGKKYMYSL